MAVKRDLPPIGADERTVLEWRRAVQEAARFTPIYGSGSPLNRIDAPVGTIYLNIDGGAGATMFVKEALGIFGWAAK